MQKYTMEDKNISLKKIRNQFSIDNYAKMQFKITLEA